MKMNVTNVSKNKNPVTVVIYKTNQLHYSVAETVKQLNSQIIEMN